MATTLGPAEANHTARSWLLMVKSRAQLARVLVVDDEPPARLRLQAMVEDLAGYTVIAVAGNGDQALQACEEHTAGYCLNGYPDAGY